jgi:hypothetical protein
MRWNRTTFSGRSFSVLVSYQFAERTHVPQTLSLSCSPFSLISPLQHAQDFYEKQNKITWNIKFLIFPSVVVPVTLQVNFNRLTNICEKTNEEQIV